MVSEGSNVKRILFVTHNLKGGGVQKITLDTARYHVEAGNDVSLLCLEKGIDLPVDFDCHFHTLDMKSFFISRPWLALYYCFYKLILRKLLPNSEFLWASYVYGKAFTKFLEGKPKFDAIFVNGIRSMNRLASVSQDNVVYSLHLPHALAKKPSSRYFRFLFKRLFSGKKIFCVSEFIRKDIATKARSLGVTIDKLAVIHNPCDGEKLSRLAQETVPFEDDYVVSVGRLTKQKRFDVLIKAYKIADIDKKLVILGEGHQRKELEQLIKELGLDQQVFLVGFDKNPFKWMKRSHFFILSSDFEGFVLVVNEALALQVPVVATDCGPITEILTGELLQGVVPKGDIRLLAEKIRQFDKQPIKPSDDVVKQLDFHCITQQQLAMVTKSARQ
ncbi:glycosyltransferase [Motilimonas pumila]|uniref:Glycosyltransferase n=1 Tax=Motilimonas pumila TaxID=2303987 RepID=A0A418YHK8_9GAMM|nr:glycosyltransferase [Motilimonas pumila]RJG49543.1 glycosyltransferase [Motilimonas pumila]